MRRRRVGVGAERPEVPRGRELQLLFLGSLQPSDGVGRGRQAAGPERGLACIGAFRNSVKDYGNLGDDGRVRRRVALPALAGRARR